MNDQSSGSGWYNGDLRLLNKAHILLQNRESWANKVIASNEREAIPKELLASSHDIFRISKNGLISQLAKIEKIRQEMETEIPMMMSSRISRKYRKGRDFRLSPNVKDFLEDFSPFIEKCAGIVEIVQTADCEFEGLAWGTLSVLLSVAVLKHEHNDAIHRAISEFARYGPRLRTLEGIDPDETLRCYVADMYSNIIDFGREAIDYYQQPSARRVNSSKTETKIAQMIDALTNGLVQIRLNCEDLMQKRLDELSIEVEDLRATFLDTQPRLEPNFRIEAGKQTTNLEKRLKTSDSLASYVVSYRKLLTDSIFQVPRGAMIPAPMTKKRIDEEPAFNNWLEELDSGILFLSGQNAPWVNQTTLLWLSQVAVLMIERFCAEGREFAYVLCQTKFRQSESPSVKSVFAQLASQLIGKRSSNPRRMDSGIGGEEGSALDNECDTVEAGISLIKEALKTYQPDETVFLIIDRLDQCGWAYEAGQSGQGMSDAINKLLSLVLTAPCKLKVLVVSASTSYNRNFMLSISSKHEPESMHRFLTRFDWNQDAE